jgi:Kef-type K+ transport system membrane component KefB
LLPSLGTTTQGGGPFWISALKTLAVVAALVVAGRYLLRPLFRWVAETHSQEVFTATALGIVVGTALLVSAVGLSMALGAFLAGVLLADSDYRHELEADIEPFKGLLLGLFFVAVGMSVHLRLIIERPGLVMGLVLGLVAIKAAVLFVMGKVALTSNEGAASLAVMISQGGEFRGGFVDGSDSAAAGRS